MKYAYGIPPARLPAAAPEAPLPPTHLVLYRRLATVFGAMTLAVAALVFYTVWSRATVVVLSRQQEVRAEFIADIAANPVGPELSGAALQATETLTRGFPAAAAARTETHAEGRVSIASSLATPQTLVAATRLLTPEGVLFRIKEAVIVPAGGSVEVDVFSDGIGAANDVGDATFIIPGLNPGLRPKFTVRTVAPIGGGVREVRLVNRQEVDAAAAELKRELSDRLHQSLRQQAEAAGLPVSGEVFDAVLVSQESVPEVGVEAEQFQLTVQVKGDGVYFDREALDRLAESRVKEVVPFGRSLRQYDRRGTSVSVEKADAAAGRVNLRVAAVGTAILAGDSPSLVPSKLAGVSAAAAVSYLEQVDGVASASVSLTPFWSRSLPRVAENIRIEVR